MATLDTNRTRLSQLQRSRSIADALTAQALQPRQIIHPYQGMQQLAEALAGGLLGLQANKREAAINEERRQAMIDALGPQYETVPAQLPPDRGVPAGDTAGVLQQFDPNGVLQGDPSGGFPAAGPGRLGPVGYTPEREVMTSPGILNERQLNMIMSLPPNAREAAWTKIVVDQFTQDPSSIGDNFVNIGLRDYKGPQGEFQGQFYREKAPPYRTGTIDREGNLTPVDSRYLNKPVEEQRDVTQQFGDEGPDMGAVYTGYQQSANMIDLITRDLSAAGSTAVGFTGSASGLVNTFWTQARAAMDLAGKSVRGRSPVNLNGRAVGTINGEVVPDHELYNPANYEEYFSGIDFGPNFQNAKARQQIITTSIKLAYAMARADDPGGRLSERDVQAQLDSMGLGQGDARLTIAALGRLRNILTDNTRFTLENMSRKEFGGSGNPYTFTPHPVPQDLQGIYQGGGVSSVLPTVLDGGAPRTVREGDIQAMPDGSYQIWRDGGWRPLQQ